MSFIGKISERLKNRIDREDLCLPELKKEIKKRKWYFLFYYCTFIIFGYIGFILTCDFSQIISLLFLSLMFAVFTIIAFIDYFFTRLLFYLKMNED